MLEGLPRFDIGFEYNGRWSRRCGSEMAEVGHIGLTFAESKARNALFDIIMLCEV